jgi:energy-coupling factor transport system ATP-binding protein
MPPSRHPRDLSEGQRLALVLAIQLAVAPRILLLDEPTRGLDYGAKRRLGDILARLTASGTAVLLSSHDVEFVARTADRVVVLADGEIIADGPVLEELTASPSFAPQLARILSPLPVLTVDAVRAILAAGQ